MKILIVGLYPKEACPIFSFALAQAFKQNGCKVFAIIPKDAVNLHDWVKTFKVSNIGVIDNNKDGSDIVKTIKKYTNIIRFLIYGNKKLRHIQKNEYDYVIYTFYHRWNNLINLYIKARNKVMIVHDPIQHSDENKKRVYNHDKQVKSMDCIIVLSKKFIPVIQEKFSFSRENIFFMPHCIMDYKFKECTKKQSSYNSEMPINFLFFGRITRYKGLSILIKAYHNLEQQYENVKLTIAGSGEFAEYIEACKNLKSVKVVNQYIDDRNVEDYFVEPNTVVVLPYIDATQSGVVAIALNYLTPIIATNTGGLLEQLDNGNIGILCKPKNVNALKSAMESFINNEEQYYEQSKLMNEYSKTLGWDSAIKKLLEEWSMKR